MNKPLFESAARFCFNGRFAPAGFALLLGVLSVFSRAPFYQPLCGLVALSGLFWLWWKRPQQAVITGYGFGLGLFGAGVSWVFVSLHDFGGMPLPLAVLSIALFCAFLAFFPAGAGFLLRYCTYPLLAMPAAWVLQEWVLSWIFTGFPWMTLGYGQVPGSPLAGFAPVVGVYGVSWILAVCASLLVGCWVLPPLRRRLFYVLIAIGFAGQVLKAVHWTRPQGAPLRVSLLQGNIAQSLKWDEDYVAHILNVYARLAQQHPATLVIFPETAIPLSLDSLPADYLANLQQLAQRQHGGMVLGVIERFPTQYYNSMVGVSDAPPQVYRKSHLVPFGEFIPLKMIFAPLYQHFLHIPLVDMASGTPYPKPLRLAGQVLGISICYEDVFGEEVIRQLPQATLLVNATNDAWYGRSWATHQHLQIAQTRALETGRMLLRAANTGVTAIIDPHGAVLARVPIFTTTALTGYVSGYQGSTPYVRWGNAPVVSLLLGMLGCLVTRRQWCARSGKP